MMWMSVDGYSVCTCSCICGYIHTLSGMSAYIQASASIIHICVNESMHTFMHTYIHAYTHGCMHAYLHMYIHACINIYNHTLLHRKIYNIRIIFIIFGFIIFQNFQISTISTFLEICRIINTEIWKYGN